MRHARATACPRDWLQVRASPVALGVAVGACLVGLPNLAAAAPPPISDNHYSIQLFQGPLLVPSRVLGSGGAYAPLAEGVEGTYVSAAAPAVREPFSYSWFDWDATLGASLPGAFAGTDFENHGSQPENSTQASSFDNFITVNWGFQVQLGPLGASVTNDIQSFTLSNGSAQRGTLRLELARLHALVAASALRGQLLIGGGVRAVGVNFTASNEQSAARALVGFTGAAPQLGVIVKPNGYPFRLAVTGRLPVSVDIDARSGAQPDAAGVQRIESLIVPNRTVLPWEIEGGFALQLGPRPLNPEWIDPHQHEAPYRAKIDAAREQRRQDRDARLEIAKPAEGAAISLAWQRDEDGLRAREDAELDVERERLLAVRRARYENWPREKVLLSATVLVTGPTDDSVSVQGFLNQQKEPFGRTTAISPRLGIEGEPIVNILRVRTGSYLEPSRFENGAARQHFTFGFDIRCFPFHPFGLFENRAFRLSLAIDLAPRYTNWGAGFGFWH